MIYNSINALKYLDRLCLLEDEFKKMYDSRDDMNFFCDYRVSSFIIDAYNLQNFIYFCTKNNIRWRNGDPAKKFFNHLIERGFISKINNILIILYIYQGNISMVYSSIIYRENSKRFPKVMYNNLIEI